MDSCELAAHPSTALRQSGIVHVERGVHRGRRPSVMGNREDRDKPMKKRFLLATIAIVASQSACSTQYRIEMEPNAFLATWNQDMHGPDMTLRRQQRNGDPGIQVRVDKASS